MLEAIRELGMYSLKEKGINVEDGLSILIQSPFGTNIKNVKNKDKILFKVIKINFLVSDNGVFYDNTYVEDYKEEGYTKYLYRRKGSNGPNFTPVAKVAEDIKKTVKGRVLAWFKNSEGTDFLPIKTIFEEFNQKLPFITNDVIKIKSDFPDKWTNFLLTVTINGKYPGEIDGFHNYFESQIKKKYKDTYTENGVCSLCGKRGEVFGNASPYAFYTLDKPGYVAGGFRKEYGWQNFPLCFNCILLLEEGRSYLEEKLGSFRFAGLSYYIVPRSQLSDVESLTDVVKVYETYKSREVKLSVEKGIAQDEDDILFYMKDLKDYYTLTFFFFSKNGNKLTIELLLEDIYPSRIKGLFEAKDKAENYEIFKNAIKQKKNIKDVCFNFNVLRQFIPSKKNFLSLVDKIFKGSKVDYSFILSSIMGKIRQKFVNEEYLKQIVLEALVILYFLRESKTLNIREGGEIMSEIIENELSSKIEAFFEEHKKSFSIPAKKAIFLIGVLTQFLLNIQRRDRGAEPFRSQLKSLKMGEEDIKALLPKIIAKLESYKENYYHKLEELISFYLVQAGDKWGMSKDEINYYFVLGMSLAGVKDKNGNFIFKKDTEGGEENE